MTFKCESLKRKDISNKIRNITIFFNDPRIIIQGIKNDNNDEKH